VLGDVKVKGILKVKPDTGKLRFLEMGGRGRGI
jgi:hypothetical protein